MGATPVMVMDGQTERKPGHSFQQNEKASGGKGGDETYGIEVNLGGTGSSGVV